MSKRGYSRFLDLRALSTLENLRFTTHSRIEGSYGGRHRSRQLGGAGEFVDFREYAVGEDLRRLDWKVLARTGRSYVRLFQDETNVRAMLAIDVSASMDFGRRSPRAAGSKLEYVQYLATALSYLIARGQDQVGLALLAGKLGHYLVPGAAPTHVDNLHAAIEEMTTQPASTMSTALRELFERFNGRGVIVLASDFLMEDLQQTFGVLKLFRHRHCEVVLLHIVHPDEEQLPAGRAFRFIGMERAQTVNCSPQHLHAAYAARFERHCQSIRALAASTGCDYRRLSTSTPYLQALGSFLIEQAG